MYVQLRFKPQTTTTRVSDSPWSPAAGGPQGTRWCSWSGLRVCACADSWGWWWARPSVCCRSGPAPPAAPVVPVYCRRWRHGYIRALALQNFIFGNHIYQTHLSPELQLLKPPLKHGHDTQRYFIPGSEGLQLVVGEVQHPEAPVSRQERDALVRQAVIGHIELLQAAEAVIR